MIKRISLLAFLAIITVSFSFGEKNATKKWKLYDHPDFSFRYPKKWRQFLSREFDDEEVYARIAPKKDIRGLYLRTYDSLLYGTVHNYLKLDKLPLGNGKEQQTTVPNREYVWTNFAETQFTVTVGKLNFKNLVSFIEERKKKIAVRDDYSGYFRRIDDNHYIHYLKAVFVDEGLGTQYIIMHFYNRKGVLYVLTFLTSYTKRDKYKETANEIFNSFRFKN